MELRFLGAATTVTGSQFLLTTKRAKILIDCGMFQGNPNEIEHNRAPLAYDPPTIDAVLLTHAHLDHCGLIPRVVKQGMHAPIFATAGTVELAAVVLLDSGSCRRNSRSAARGEVRSEPHARRRAMRRRPSPLATTRTRYAIRSARFPRRARPRRRRSMSRCTPPRKRSPRSASSTRSATAPRSRSPPE